MCQPQLIVSNYSELTQSVGGIAYIYKDTKTPECFQLFRINPIGGEMQMVVPTDHNSFVSNYSELTQSVGKALFAEPPRATQCFQLFRINPIGGAWDYFLAIRATKTVSNYSELTQSVGK